MRAISIKAVLIGNIVNLITMIFIFPFLAALVWLMVLHSALPSGEIQIGRDIVQSRFPGGVVAGMVGADLLAGYVGARLAKRAPLLNAALATSLCFLVLLFSDMRISLGNAPLDWLILNFVCYGHPLVAMLGGCLAMARRQPAPAF
jgi:hypothetical protein